MVCATPPPPSVGVGYPGTFHPPSIAGRAWAGRVDASIAHASTYSAAAAASSPALNLEAPLARASAANARARASGSSSAIPGVDRSTHGPKVAGSRPSSSPPSSHTTLTLRRSPLSIDSGSSVAVRSASLTIASRRSSPSDGGGHRSLAQCGPSPGAGIGSPPGDTASAAVVTGRILSPTTGSHVDVIARPRRTPTTTAAAPKI